MFSCCRPILRLLAAFSPKKCYPFSFCLWSLLFSKIFLGLGLISASLSWRTRTWLIPRPSCLSYFSLHSIRHTERTRKWETWLIWVNTQSSRGDPWVCHSDSPPCSLLSHAAGVVCLSTFRLGILSSFFSGSSGPEGIRTGNILSHALDCRGDIQKSNVS